MQVKGGGDAAAGSAEGGRESPAGVHGCCGYCCLRKKAAGVRAASPWFDAAACDAAEIRTCWADTCRAHERPPGCPPTHDPKCPDCPFVCSASNVAASRKRLAEMTPSAAVNDGRKRRKVHAGVEEHQPKLVHQDHKHRQFSALHLMLNGCGTNIGITLAGGAQPKVLKQVNAELGKGKYNAYWRIRESKKERDVRPNGPECRKLLFTPGLIQSLCRIRYGVTTADPAAVAAAAELDAAQRQGAHLLATDATRDAVRPAARPPVPARPAPPTKKQVPVGSRSVDAAAMLARMGGLDARPRPAPTPAPAPAPAPAASDADAADAAADADADADEGEGWTIRSRIASSTFPTK